MWVAGISALQQRGRQAPPLNMYIGGARRSRSLHRNARKLSLSMQAGNGVGESEKHKVLQWKAPPAQIRRMRRKEGQERISADGPEPQKVHLSLRWYIADCSLSSRPASAKPHYYPCCRRDTVYHRGRRRHPGWPQDGVRIEVINLASMPASTR